MAEESIEQRLAEARAVVARLEEEKAKAGSSGIPLAGAVAPAHTTAGGSTTGEYWYRVVLFFIFQFVAGALLVVPTAGLSLLVYGWPALLLPSPDTTGPPWILFDIEKMLLVSVVTAFAYSMVISWFVGRRVRVRRALELLRERESA